MPKGITKEQILDATLDMLRDNEDVRSVNMRQVAKHLGCAHTNLYNYYTNYDQILWDAIDLIYLRLYYNIIENYDNVETMDISLQFYFLRIVQFFLDNKGWFKLVWQEPLTLDEHHSGAANYNEITTLVHNMLANTMKQKYGSAITREDIKSILHTVHCYLYGELILFMSNRSSVKDEIDFEHYVLDKCNKLLEVLTPQKKDTRAKIEKLTLAEME